MKEIATKCEMLLTKSVTSKPFSAGGHWRLRTYGPWNGELRLETRSDEEARWHPTIALRHEGQRHPFGDHMPQHDRPGGTQRGTHAYYRFVFKTQVKKQSGWLTLVKKFAPATQLPRVVFEAESVVIDP